MFVRKKVGNKLHGPDIRKLVAIHLDVLMLATHQMNQFMKENKVHKRSGGVKRYLY